MMAAANDSPLHAIRFFVARPSHWEKKIIVLSKSRFFHFGNSLS